MPVVDTGSSCAAWMRARYRIDKRMGAVPRATTWVRRHGRALGIHLALGVILLLVSEVMVRWNRMTPWDRLSYDLVFLPPGSPPKAGDVLIVEVDGDTRAKYGASGGQWLARTNYSVLLDRLEEHPPAVLVIDITLSARGTAAEDEALASTLGRLPNVFLAGHSAVAAQGEEPQLQPPMDPVLRVVSGWGLDNTLQSRCVRRLYGNVPKHSPPPSLAWVAATNWLRGTGRENLALERSPMGERWMNYYGPPRQVFTHSNFLATVDWLDADPAALRGKTVFLANLVGGWDVWDHPAAGEVRGVEVMATAFTNLRGGEWLNRCHLATQLVLVALWSVLIAWLLTSLPAPVRYWILVGVTLAMVVVSILLARPFLYWWPWAVPVVMSAVAVGAHRRDGVAMPLRRSRAVILFLSANPAAGRGGALALEREVNRIEKEIESARFRDDLEFRSRWAVDFSEVTKCLMKFRPCVVHFSGHGSEGGAIIFENSQGQPQPVPPDALRDMFAALGVGRVRLVVLNACFTRAQAEAMVEVVDCAVGMHADIEDTAAIEFARQFYQVLGWGGSVRSAYEAGRAAMKVQNLAEASLPVLCHRAGVDPAEVRLVEPSRDGDREEAGVP